MDSVHVATEDKTIHLGRYFRGLVNTYARKNHEKV